MSPRKIEFDTILVVNWKVARNMAYRLYTFKLLVCLPSMPHMFGFHYFEFLTQCEAPHFLKFQLHRLGQRFPLHYPWWTDFSQRWINTVRYLKVFEQRWNWVVQLWKTNLRKMLNRIVSAGILLKKRCLIIAHNWFDSYWMFSLFFAFLSKNSKFDDKILIFQICVSAMDLRHIVNLLFEKRRFFVQFFH